MIIGPWAIRGFADQFSKSMLVMVDGRSLYTPLFAGVYWALQDGILLEDVERVEVIRGPGGTIWGANAVTGVINIITKRAKDTHGTLASVEAEASIKASAKSVMDLEMATSIIASTGKASAEGRVSFRRSRVRHLAIGSDGLPHRLGCQAQ